MKKIFNRIYVAKGADVELMSEEEKKSYYIVYCAKYPFHKETVGYTGCCPKSTDKEHDIAKREGFCCLNIIDNEKESLINRKAMERGLKVAYNEYMADKSVLFVCNQGISRSPTMGMLLVAYVTRKAGSYHVLSQWMRGVYPDFNAKAGISIVGEKIFRSF